MEDTIFCISHFPIETLTSRGFPSLPRLMKPEGQDVVKISDPVTGFNPRLPGIRGICLKGPSTLCGENTAKSQDGKA